MDPILSLVIIIPVMFGLGFAIQKFLLNRAFAVSSEAPLIIAFGISLIVGFPGETQQDFHDSLNFVINNRAIIPKIEQVNPFIYYEGTDADKQGDYKMNGSSLERMKIFIAEIKRHNFKYTNAFLGNLIEKNEYTVAASGAIFDTTDKASVLKFFKVGLKNENIIVV
jgi:tRNA A37 methylthiotransferase MiaB